MQIAGLLYKLPDEKRIAALKALDSLLVDCEIPKTPATSKNSEIVSSPLYSAIKASPPHNTKRNHGSEPYDYECPIHGANCTDGPYKEYSGQWPCGCPKCMEA